MDQTSATTAPDLAALAAEWQVLLRLRDWRLDVSYAPDLCDAAGRPVWGLCSPIVDSKTATIIIRDPATPPDGCTVEQAVAQVEETVCHEIAHLWFSPFNNRYPAEIAAEENAVWAFSEALAGLKGSTRGATLSRVIGGVFDGALAATAARRSHEPVSAPTVYVARAAVPITSGAKSMVPTPNDGTLSRAIAGMLRHRTAALAPRNMRQMLAGFSFESVTSAVNRAMHERFPDPQYPNGSLAYLMEIYDEKIIYGMAGKTYDVAYVFDGATATLAASAVEVRRSYEPVSAPTVYVARAAVPITSGAKSMVPTPEEMASILTALELPVESTVDDLIAAIGAMIKELSDAAGAAGNASEPAAVAPEEPEMAAAVRVLGRLTGKIGTGPALDEVERWRASHVALESERAKVSRDRAELEAGERRALVTRLVTDCGEAPATAWADFSERAPSKPAEPWASMALASLRSRVAALSGKGAQRMQRITPSSGDDNHGLSERELAMCRSKKIDIAAYAAKRAGIAKSSGRPAQEN